MVIASRHSATCLTRCPASVSSPAVHTFRPNIQPFSARERRRTSAARLRRCVISAEQSQGGNNFQIPAILKLANGATSSAANLVPASVPRPIAKAGVIGVTSLVALWIFGKVISTIFTVAAVGGAIFLLVKSQGSGSSKTNPDESDEIDPVASARRIMDKYK